MMQDVTWQERTPAVARLRRYGWVSTAIGGSAAFLCVILVCFTEQYRAMTGLALGAIALQVLALAFLFAPAFVAFCGELRDGTVRVDAAREKAAMGKPPLWLVVLMAAIVAVNVPGLFWQVQSAVTGMAFALLVLVLLYTRGWPTGETQAQQAGTAAALGMCGLMLSMIPGMLAGRYLENSGILDVPHGVAFLGLAALMVISGMAVFFSTISVIGRARHAH